MAEERASLALPSIHKDPFDRVMVAQAISEGIVLVTHDELLAHYGKAVRQC
ncbi:MAG: hypothetical protein LBP28_03180 [Coriobacteriales bacterium]|nr:hypothetical protein [Coriobacteriales bacterium]